MKKFKFLIIILIFAIMFILFQNITISFNTQISPRKVINPPLKGNWIVEKYVFINDSSFTKEDANKFINKTLHIDKNSIYFNNKVCKNPNFKIKVVNSRNYFWDRFKIKSSSIGITQENIQIITVYCGNNFFDYYIKIDNNYIIKNCDGLLLFLKNKKSKNKNYSLNKLEEKNSKLLISNDEKNIKSKSGILLGMKYKNPNYDNAYYYRTLWISYEYGTFNEILTTKNLLLPRENGFWQIGIHSTEKNNTPCDILWGLPFNTTVKKHCNKNKKLKPKNINYKYENKIKILFVGNDYIAVDNEHLYTKGATPYTKKYLQVLPLDNLSGKGIDITKILGKNSSKIDPFYYKNKINDKNINTKMLKTNWGVMRRSGKWILRGRFNPKNSYIDFDISYATPKILTTYDDLYPSFTDIKHKVPEAIDAYTSPNKDFILVITKTKLLAFPINKNKIGEAKITLELNDNEKVVMSQWATGNYVDNWTKEMNNKIKSNK